MRRFLIISAFASIGVCAVVLFFSRLDRGVEDAPQVHHDALEAEQLECLAKNVYFEARNEPKVGQRLVADVTLRRWRANRPKEFGGPTLCGVVYHKTTRIVNGKSITTAQFSWTLASAIKQIPFEWQKWESAQRIAREAWAERYSSDDASKRIMWYMNPRASDLRNACWFRRTLVLVESVGRHQAFREPKTFFERIELLAAKLLPQCRSVPKEKTGLAKRTK